MVRSATQRSRVRGTQKRGSRSQHPASQSQRQRRRNGDEGEEEEEEDEDEDEPEDDEENNMEEDRPQAGALPTTEVSHLSMRFQQCSRKTLIFGLRITREKRMRWCDSRSSMKVGECLYGGTR